MDFTTLLIVIGIIWALVILIYYAGNPVEESPKLWKRPNYRPYPEPRVIVRHVYPPLPPEGVEPLNSFRKKDV